MSTIREQIDAGIHQLKVFKNPDLTEVTATLKLLVVQCELGAFGKLRGEIVDMEYGDEVLIVGVVDYRRDSEYEQFDIPLEVIDAADPVVAAQVYAKEQKIWNYKNWIDSWERTRDEAQAKIDEFTLKLKELE